MDSFREHNIVSLVVILFLFPVVIYGWGYEGHYAVCKIAQARLTDTAATAVKEFLPEYAQNDLASVCIWPDRIKFRYPWSSPLHYINTPEVCNYKYTRDCKNEEGEQGMCVAGAINNYTSQLLRYGTKQVQYNLTEALLFLSHFMGDIHQPLHVSFADDKGGNTIDVHWYTRKQNLHHVWDSNIIETAEEKYDNSNLDTLVDAIQQNITKEWSDEVPRWETCGGGKSACPDIYASESINAACDWAYKGVVENATLEDDYFLSRLPIVYRRLAQGGVRLAATLNRIFG
ncbi:endonuclease 2-like [Rutidosis leptorrhynchoides]|uniref:endonuclease 2-like n=1 Tax=Rutidosis leptorrhynchoides TaxID=125765 RepID=UPI003A99DC23